MSEKAYGTLQCPDCDKSVTVRVKHLDGGRGHDVYWEVQD